MVNEPSRDAFRGEPGPVTMFGPDFPFPFDDWIAHPAGLGSLPAERHGEEVAIVGVGISGLVAAYELMRLGLRPAYCGRHSASCDGNLCPIREGAVSMAQQSNAIGDVWRDQRQWSRAASRLKRGIIFWRSTALAFSILGAVLATVATQVGLKSGLGQGLSLASALALAVVPIIREVKLSKDGIETWTRARSASEGLKAEVYLYITRTPPYDGADRDVQLTDHADKIKRDVDDIAGHTLGLPDADKQLPAVNDVGSYLASRVQPQIDEYYRPSAVRQQQRLTLFRSIEFALSLTAVLLSAIAATTHVGGVSAWVAVVTTVAAAITAHIAAARYEHLVISYLATARQLEALVRTWRDGTDKSAGVAAKLISDCESVISRENESWMAAWSRKDGSQQSQKGT